MKVYGKEKRLETAGLEGTFIVTSAQKNVGVNEFVTKNTDILL